MEVIAATQQPDFIILSETHMTENVNEQEINLENYNNILALSNSSRTGGVIIYFKKSWSIKKISEKICDFKYWIVVCEAKYKTEKVVITAVYRSPSSQDCEFYEVFEELMEELTEKDTDIIIAGDFNIDYNRESFYKSRINNILNDNGLKQIVNESTRITSRSRTLIDYVITNNHSKISAKNNNVNKISDHEAIEIKIECNSEKQNNSCKKIDIFKYNKNLFNSEIRTILKMK